MEKSKFTVVRSGTKNGFVYAVIALPGTEKDEVPVTAFLGTKNELKVGSTIELITKFADNLNWAY